jgi:hypothetical protein
MAGPVDQDKGDVPYLEGMGGRIRIYSKKFSRAAGMSLLRALNIIDQSEIVLPGKPQVQCLSVGDTQKLDRIVVDPAFDILLGNAIDLDLAIHSFENSGIVVIGELCGRQLNSCQLRFIIMPEIQLRLQLQVGSVLHKIIQNPVTEPVKKQNSH